MWLNSGARLLDLQISTFHYCKLKKGLMSLGWSLGNVLLYFAYGLHNYFLVIRITSKIRNSWELFLNQRNEHGQIFPTVDTAAVANSGKIAKSTPALWDTMNAETGVGLPLYIRLVVRGSLKYKTSLKPISRTWPITHGQPVCWHKAFIGGFFSPVLPIWALLGRPALQYDIWMACRLSF